MSHKAVPGASNRIHFKQKELDGQVERLKAELNLSEHQQDNTAGAAKTSKGR